MFRFKYVRRKFTSPKGLVVCRVLPGSVLEQSRKPGFEETFLFPIFISFSSLLGGAKNFFSIARLLTSKVYWKARRLEEKKGSVALRAYWETVEQREKGAFPWPFRLPCVKAILIPEDSSNLLD